MSQALSSRAAARRAAAEVAEALALNVPGAQPAAALALGLAQLTAAELLRVLRAVGLGFSGEPTSVGEPRFVSSLTLLDTATGDAVAAPTAQRNQIEKETVSRLFEGQRDRRFFAAVLQAVAKPGGTLAALADLPEARKGRLFAKTGTHSVSGRTQALVVAGVVLREGKP